MKELYQISKEKLLADTKIRLDVKKDPYEIFNEFALEMAAEIIKNNEQERRTVLICPCGPVEQYGVFARIVNMLKISLRNVWIINMDEYLDDNGERISGDDEFSFRHIMDENLYSKIDSALIMPEEQRVFPDPADPGYISELIEKLGGVDISFGGVALNGHVAFNEPEPELSKEAFAALPTRVVKLTPETRIKDAILSRGGAVDTVPTKAITIGMKEILSGRKVRLSVMNQMQRAVIRRACLGEVSPACPVSYLQEHADACLYVLETVTEKPF